MKIRDSLGRFFDGLGRKLKSEDREPVSFSAPPQDEAEMALRQAMGWDGPGDSDTAAAAAAKQFKEVLGE